GARGIAVDGSGNVYVTGYFANTADFGSYTLTSVSLGSQDIFIEKLDSAGTVQWAKRLLGPDDASGRGFHITVDAGGNSYVTGVFFTIPSGNNEVFVEKIDSDGAVQWVKGMGGAAPDRGYGIAVDARGN